MTLAVQHSPDLERILALPRRDWRTGIGGRFGTAAQLVEGLTWLYRRAGSSARLRACQAVGLAECADFGGLFGPLQVGAGKTLLSLLLPLVCRASRPVLLVPARHRQKTLSAWDEYARDWHLPGIDVRGIAGGTRAPTWSEFRGRVKIVSGGQTGADRGALDAAIALGLEHGGLCPRRRRAEDGQIPNRYQLMEMAEGDYLTRTRANVEQSDATLVFGRGPATPGSRRTLECARAAGKSYLYLDLQYGWLDVDLLAVREFASAATVLNVAGSRESKRPGITREAENVLRRALGGPTLIVESYERISRNSFDRAYLVHLAAAERLVTAEGRNARIEQAARAFNDTYPVGQPLIVGDKRAILQRLAAVVEGRALVGTSEGVVPLADVIPDIDLLGDLRPDLVIADEAHCLANRRAAVTKRVRRALEMAETSGSVRFAALSGTVTRRSIRDYAHLVRWALGARAPLPLAWPALQEWAAYLDEGADVVARPQPGALVRLVPSERQLHILSDPVTEVRRGFAGRVEASPGVVSVQGRGCAASLEVSLVRYEIRDSALLDALAKFRVDWILPDGRPICDTLEYARHLRELSCGFFYHWTIDPPEKWLSARRAWRKFVHGVLGRDRDTELQIAHACARGELNSGGAYQDWRAIRDSFRLVTEPAWISDEVLRACVDYVRGGEPALIWTSHVAVLERLGEISGWPAFGAGRGSALERFVQDQDDHAICSINACADGFNLQARARSVVLGWPRAGRTAEQLIGRTHRDPTIHDEVAVTAFCATAEAAEDLVLSWQDAKYIQDTTGVPQKLVFCDKSGWTPT